MDLDNKYGLLECQQNLLKLMSVFGKCAKRTVLDIVLTAVLCLER